jgi:homoserine O-acetyltransferase
MAQSYPQPDPAAGISHAIHAMNSITRRHTLRILSLGALLLAPSISAQTATPGEGDFIIRNFRFTTGEVLPEVPLHYRTLGKPARDASGQVRNAVLIMHGTGGSGAQFLNPIFAG